MPAGTMIVLISSGPVRAVTVITEVMSLPEFVMNALAPSITHSSPTSSRAGPGPAGVGAGLGLGQAERGEPLAGHQVGQPGHALLLGAVREDRVDPEPDRGLERDAHRLVDPADLLDRHAQAGEVRAGPAVLLGHRQAEQPELAHGMHGVDREVVVGVPGRGVRRDLGIGELADDLAEVLVLVGQGEGHGSASRVVEVLRLR